MEEVQALKCDLEQYKYRKALLKIKTLDGENFYGYIEKINDHHLTILNDRTMYTAIVRLDRIANVIQLTAFEAMQ